MASYYRVNVLVETSATSDFAKPKSQLLQRSGNGTLTVLEQEIEAAAAGAAIQISTFASIAWMLVKNTSATLTVTFTWTDAGAHSNSISLAPGEVVFLEDINVVANPTLTEATAAAICQVSYSATA